MRRDLIAHPSPSNTQALAAFFERWRGFNQAEAPERVAVRLGALLEELRPLIAAQAAKAASRPPPHRRGLERDDVARLLDVLGPAVTAARLQGAVLNVWTTSGLRRDEVRNARVLAAMFSQVESPDRGGEFLQAFLDRIGGGDRSRLPTRDELTSAYTVQTEACPLGAADDRVDLSIEGAGFICLIEVKIDAGEGREQLARYESVMRRKAEALGKRAVLIYLSPSRPNVLPAGAFYADWSIVAKSARAVVSQRPRNERSVQDLLLWQFAEHIRQFS